MSPTPQVNSTSTSTSTSPTITRSRVITTLVLVLLVTSSFGAALSAGTGVAAADHDPGHNESAANDSTGDEGGESESESGDRTGVREGVGILPGDPSSITGTGANATTGDAPDETADESDIAGENETGNESGNETGNETGAGDGEGEDDGILAGLGNMAPSWDPASWGEGTVEWIRGWLFEGYSFLINNVVNELLGTPRMVNDGAEGVFGFPVEDPDVPTSILFAELFHSVLIPYVAPLIGGFLGFVLLGATIGPVISAIGKGSAERLVISALTVALGLVVYWDFVSLLHNGSHWITQWFLPDATDILDSNMALESGPTAAVVGMLLFGWSKGVVLTAILSGRYAFLIAAPFAFPFFLVMAYGGMFKTIKMIGSFVIWQYYGMLVMPWPIAFLLRIALAIDFSGLFPDTYLGQEIADFLTMSVTIGFWLGAFFVPFIVMGSFGVASILGRGMFAAKLAGGVARLKGAVGGTPSGGSGSGSGTGLGGSSGANRAASLGRSRSRNSQSPNAARQSAAAARADGGWTSRKLANGTSSDSTTGSPLSRAGGRDSTRRRRGSGTDRSTLSNVLRSREAENGVASGSGNGKNRPTVDDRRRAAHEKARAKRANKGRSGRYGSDKSRTR